MAANSVYGSVSTPRVYCDIISYAKAIGHVKHILSFNTTGDPLSAWDFNPAKITTYTSTGSASSMTFGIRFNNYPYDAFPIERQFGNLLSTINYFGALGHNFGLAADGNIDFARIGLQGAGSDYNDALYYEYEAIVGNFLPNNDLGYSLYKLTNSFSQSDKIDALWVYVYKDSGADFLPTDTLDIGTWTVGRYFDFPNSPDLSVSLNFSHDGSSTQRTVGGSDVTDIAYTKPDWGRLPAWSNINLDDYADPNAAIQFGSHSKVAYKGRRSWTIRFSYIDKENVFPKAMDGNMAGLYTPGDYADSSFDVGSNIIGNYLALTMGGQIGHLLQPDNTKNEFAMVKLDKNSLSINQVAFGVYNISMTFVEFW